jgi:hypothetical protein
MSVIFTKALADNVLTAYNNNTIEFYSDTFTTPLKATIQIGATPPVVIYPQPSGVFYYNFKTLIASIINQDNFKDDIAFIAGPYNYDWSKVYNEDNVQITISLTDLSTDDVFLSPKWLAGFFQRLTPFRNTQLYGVTTPLRGLQILSQAYADKRYAKMWLGYPFDITFLNSNLGDPDYDLMQVVNYASGIAVPLTEVYLGYKVTRLLIHDGEESLHPFEIKVGLNPLAFTDTMPNTPFRYLDLEVVDPCFKTDYLEQTPQLYVKWLNSLGGWNYWLFDSADIVRNTKDLGEIDNDGLDLNDSVSPTIQIGKTSTDRYSITTDVIDRQELMVLNDLLDSEKIFIYTKPAYSAYLPTNWLQVSLNTNSVNVQKSKNKFNRFDLVLETPQRENRTI